MAPKSKSVRSVLAKMGLSVTLLGSLAACGIANTEIISNPPPSPMDAGETDALVIGNLPPPDGGADAGEGTVDASDANVDDAQVIGNAPADAG